MIRLEYPKVSLEGLSDKQKIYALKGQLDSLTNSIQLVLESINGDIEGINDTLNEIKNGEE